MSDTNYTRWYREGSASLTQNSDIVTGSNTYWLNANIKPGDMFTLDSSKFYEVENVDSNTQITLKTPYLGATISNANYAVIRNFTATLPAETAAKVVTVLAKNEKYVDEPMNTLRGQSAYEIAVDKQGFVGNESEWLETLNAYGQAKKNGFVGSLNDWLESLTAFGIAKDNGFSGSEADWLESLIGAGQWQLLNKRTKLLDTENVTSPFYTCNNNIMNRPSTHASSQAYLHNSIVRGKNLGSKITQAQLEAIQNGTFEDMYVGDYWAVTELGGITYNNIGYRFNQDADTVFFQIVEINRYKSMYEGGLGDGIRGSERDTKEGNNIYSEFEKYEDYNYDNLAWNIPIDADTGKVPTWEKRPSAIMRNHLVVMASVNFNGVSFLHVGDKDALHLDQTGYAYDDILRKNIKDGNFIKNIAYPAFGEEYFLTWIEKLYTTLDTEKQRPAGPRNFLCKVEIPSIEQFTGLNFVGDNFAQAPTYSDGGEGPVYHFGQQMFSLFKKINPLSTYSPCFTRDYVKSDVYMWLRDAHYVMPLKPGINSGKIWLTSCPYFCIGVDSDE